MIKLSNGYQIEFANASGARAFGLDWPWYKPLRWLKALPDSEESTTFIKTLTSYRRKGNLQLGNLRQLLNGYRHCVQRVRVNRNPIGLENPKPFDNVLVTVNRVGLSNPGLDHWLRMTFPVLQWRKIPHIVSIMAENTQQARLIGWLLNKKRGMLKGLEVNFSCPNTGHRDASVEGAVAIVKAIQKETDHPIGIKLAWQDPHVEIAKALEGMVEWVTLINTIPWNIIFPDKPTPFYPYVGWAEPGGVSGEAIYPYAIEAIGKHIAAGINIPVIACGGITKPEHVYGFAVAGAKAYQIGTLYKDDPLAVKPLIKACKKAFTKGRTAAGISGSISRETCSP